MTKDEVIVALERTIKGKEAYLEEIQNQHDLGSLAIKALMPLWLADLNKILEDIRRIDTSN